MSETAAQHPASFLSPLFHPSKPASGWSPTWGWLSVLYSLSWPPVAAGFLALLVNIVSLAFAGSLGTNELAGTSHARGVADHHTISIRV